MQAFECLFPHNIVAAGASRIRHGLDEFDFLHSSFKPLLPHSDGPVEDHNRFKLYVVDHWRAASTAEYVQLALSDCALQRIFPVAHRLLFIAATLPMTSVECERYFCILKRVKSEVRNRLSVSANSSVLIAATDSACVEDYSPLECIAEWFEKKKRKRAAELSALDAAEDDSVVNGAE